MARRLAPDADHRAAYMAGRAGGAMPAGVAAKATADPSLDFMHDAGRNGVDYDEALKTHAPTVHSAVQPPAPRGTPRGASRKGGLNRPKRPSLRRPLGGLTSGADVPHTVGGLLLGGVAYALVLSVVDYGMAGPRLWFKAKFLNEAAPAPAKMTPSLV